MTQKNIPARFIPQQIVCLENLTVELGIPGPNKKFLIFGPGIPGLNHFRIFHESPVFHFSPKWAKILEQQEGELQRYEVK